MSLYRKIEVSMYGDKNFKALSPMLPSAQSLWGYLLTGPHTGPIPGLFVSGPASMAEALKWPPRAFNRCFSEILTLKMAKIDMENLLIWIPNAIKYNKPESPNVILHWTTEFNLLPECALRDEAIAFMRAYIVDMGQGYAIAFDKVFGKAIGKPLEKPIEKPSGKAIGNQLTGTVNSKQEEDKRGEAPPAEPSVLAKVDPLYHKIKSSFETVYGRLPDYAREGKAIYRILKFSDNDESMVGRMIEAFYRLTKSPDKYWSGQPFLPSILASGGIWPRVLLETQKNTATNDVSWFERYAQEGETQEAVG